MKNNEELLSFNEIMQLLKTNNKAILKLEQNDSEFPKPCTEPTEKPKWKLIDITNYLYYKDEKTPNRNISSKKIAIVGRARGGKSFFASRFVYDKKGFTELFCGNNSDKTACPVHIKISESHLYNHYIFHSDFECTDTELNDQISVLSGKRYLNHEKDIMDKIEKVINKINEIEENYDQEQEKSHTFIESYQQPSKFCSDSVTLLGYMLSI